MKVFNKFTLQQQNLWVFEIDVTTYMFDIYVLVAHLSIPAILNQKCSSTRFLFNSQFSDKCWQALSFHSPFKVTLLLFPLPNSFKTVAFHLV